MSKKTFGHIAKQLAELGYEPVPIIRGEKRPAVDGWQEGGWEKHTEQFERNFTGLLTRYLPAIDIDVSDPVVVKGVRDIVNDVLGCYDVAIPRRVGREPRELLMFRTEEPFQKVSTAGYKLPTDVAGADGKVKASKVEILADGQQFVSYAIHPDTGKPYYWNGGGEPLEIERNSLMVLDEAQAREIVARCEGLLGMFGERIEREAMSRGAMIDRVPAEHQEADDPILAQAALGGMPNPDLAFDDWLRIMFAVKGGLGEDGFDAFMRWSAKSNKHDEEFAEREWRKAKPVRIGAGSLIWMARQLGWSPASTQLVSGDGDDVGQTPQGLVWVHMSGGKTPRPLASLENFEVLSAYLGVSYSMDVMTGQEIIVVPGLKVAEGTEANSAVTHMMSQAIIAGLPHALVPDFMSMLCAKNPFHPARIWVESKPWDGTSRLAAWYATIQAKDGQALKERMMRKWAISCIAALFKHGGVSAHGVLTLLGDQGIGKTSWLLNLVPRGLGFAKDGMILRPDSPDSVRQVTSAWLVELGELDATFRKSDIAALKAFITQDSDTYRLPYARKNTVNPRRTVFFASVNDVKFLSDSTGNRRYWTIDCENINYQHDIDMQQLWAEVKVLFDNGENWYLDNEELLELNDSNEQFMSVDPVVERLETRLEWGADGLNWAWKTATEIAQMVGIENPNRGDATRIAVHLQKVKGCTRNRSHGVSKILVPPKIQENWF